LSRIAQIGPLCHPRELTAERLRRTRQIGLADFVNRLRGGCPAPAKVTAPAEFVVPTGGPAL
jgi:hypothetical protein